MHTTDAPVGRRLAGQSKGLVVADHVRIRFGDIEAAGPISFSVMRGEFVSLLVRAGAASPAFCAP
jgi:ABC-type branched-subunit amino acid transport system ATPase component